jgi:hypothetical protein
MKTRMDEIAFSRIRAVQGALLGVVLTLACLPASAEIDLSGSWVAYLHEDAMNRGAGPFPVDYMGLPLNAAGRARALLYSASQIAMPERQCLYYTSEYLTMGPFGFKMWNDTEPINGHTTAWHISGTNDRAPITIWVDGRPDASQYAIHAIGGYATGEWEGDVLKARITHMKAGYIWRNGSPTSDQASITLHFIRHGDMMLVISELQDPVYLSEPLVISRNYMRGTTNIRPIDTPCVPGDEATRKPGEVPHYMPGKNPFVDDLTKLFNVPPDAVLGGAETMYPAYRKKLKSEYTPPVKCPRDCGYGAFRTSASQ